jgi:hypothetical protein
MASRLEEFNAMKIKIGNAIAKGDRAFLNEKIHVVDHAAERERKLSNPKKSTKVIFNCRTPEQYKEFQAAKEAYFEIAIDPHIAVDCIIRALSAFSPNVIREWVKQGFGPGEPPPAAAIPTELPGQEVPEWLK